VLVVILICFPTILWVGSTDLNVVFVVLDRDTKERISGADVEFGSYGHDEGFSGEVRLKTDAVGVAFHVIENVRSSGRSGALEWKETFVVNVPYWQYRITAVGYEPIEFVFLRSHVQPGSIKQNGPRKSLIEVPVELRKINS
jgi:hypothetical protein